MRIAHVIDYFHTDVGYQEYYLALSMSSSGHKVAVITSELRQHTVAVPIDDAGEGERRLLEAGVELTRLSARQLGHDRAWLSGLNRALRRFGPDVVHCHGPFSPTTVRIALACRRAHIPLLVDTHIHEAIAPASSTLLGRCVYATYRWTAGPLLRRVVRTWVANGPHEAAFLEQRLGLPTGSVALVPLGFDPAVFGPDDQAGRRERIDRGWGSELIVAATGKLHTGKRVDLTARACEQLVGSRPVRLVLAGSMEPGVLDQVRSAAPTLVKRGCLDVLPMLPSAELAALYRAADVVVFARLPSISIYEAAGTGARVLVGRDQFADWLAVLHRGILSVEPSQIAASLERPSDRVQLAADAEAAFGWSVVSDNFCVRYRRIQGAKV